MIYNFFFDLYAKYGDIIAKLMVALLFVGMVLSFLYRLYLAKTVEYYLEAKQLENSKFWKYIVFLFGIIAVVLCWIINRGVGKNDFEKQIKSYFKKLVIITCLFGVLCVPFDLIYDSCNNIEELEKDRKEISYYYEPYLDTDLKVYFFYDKMGNYYTASKVYDGVNLYDKNNNCYIQNDHDYYCEDIGKTVKFDDAFIDENGFIVEKKNLKAYTVHDEEFMNDYNLFYYDENNNIYYAPSSCSWDMNGNLVLKEEIQKFDFSTLK